MLSSDGTNPSVKNPPLKWLIFATSPKGEAFEAFLASPSGEVPSVSEAEGFPFLCNFQICSFNSILLLFETVFQGNASVKDKVCRGAVLIGMGSVGSLFQPYFRFNYSHSDAQADRTAIESDFGTIGNDIQNVMISYR